ncbi:MAG TPA: hypothetical protein EYN22_06820 [Nitrospinaceae bacterium]|nr:hypothetical protein [Nitrospinaceae bacterium]
MSFGREYLEESKPTSFCPVCGAQILPKTIFCFECGPPDLPKKEPEETGISLEQAVIRIGVLVFLFVCVVLVKYDTFTDYLVFLADQDSEVQSSIDGKKVQDDGFELIHTVIPSSANVRSKPSIDGHVIAIVEEGMNLTLIEKKEDWTKIHVFEKTGWIASRLIKSEVQTIK